MGSKMTVVFDFDGVIHSYKSGWKGTAVIPDPPVEGIREAIQIIRQDYEVVVCSSRCESDAGISAIYNWLDKWNIQVDGVSVTKPPAIVYVDDRAICFQGDASLLIHQIKSFRPWTQRR